MADINENIPPLDRLNKLEDMQLYTKAVIAYTEQLRTISTTLATILEHSTESHDFLNNTSGLNKVVKEALATLEKSHTDIITLISADNEQYKIAFAKTLDKFVSKVVLRITLAFLGSTAIFGFIVAIVNFISRPDTTEIVKQVIEGLKASGAVQ